MPVRPQVKKVGTAQAAAKLDDEKVRQIRLERQGGATIKALSEKYKVNQGTISQVCNRTAWGHVS